MIQMFLIQKWLGSLFLPERFIDPHRPEVKGLDKGLEDVEVLLVGDVLPDHVLAEVRVLPEEGGHLPRVRRLRQ